MAQDPETRAEWAELLKQNWEKRAASDARDFFVASHPGWDQEQHWLEQAEREAGIYFTQLEHTQAWELLEIGCGVGRLAAPLLQRVKHYTGVDIAQGMVAEARRRCSELERARFFVSDGISLPPSAMDRAYRMVLVASVFIHCPLSVIASTLESAWQALETGGVLRFNLRADSSDPTGISAPIEVQEATHRSMQEIQSKPISEQQMNLVDEHYYMGHMFRYDEVEGFLRKHTAADAEVVLYRADLAMIFASLVKP